MKSNPDPAATRERFLTRWSRLKRTGAVTAEAVPATPQTSAVATSESGAVPDVRGVPPATVTTPTEVAASLPPIESLSIESDFAPFFQPKVPEALRRAAVKKLFADPRFNVMDGLDVYIDDYSKPDPISPEMLKGLVHARDLIDHPSNRIEREQAAGAGEQASPVAETDGSNASASAGDASTAAPAEAPPTTAEPAADAMEPADSAPPTLTPTNRPAGAG